MDKTMEDYAKEWYDVVKSLANKGNPYACIVHVDAVKNKSEHIKYIITAAELGHYPLQKYLGKYYLQVANGNVNDLQKSKKWILRALDNCPEGDHDELKEISYDLIQVTSSLKLYDKR